MHSPPKPPHSDSSTVTDAQILSAALRALTIERDALTQVTTALDQQFVAAVQLILQTTQPVVVIGMGKSGHIGHKIAATLASTGTPAFFVHPAEAAHGDLGMLVTSHVVLALSNSGETQEIIALLPHLKRLQIKLIALTGNSNSTLARYADIHLDGAVAQEACPLNLAPTASTTAALALGDALAVVLLECRGFGANDFARSHPGGSLGRRLLTQVSDVMRPLPQVPRVSANTSLIDALLEMTSKGMAMTTITGDGDELLGVFTDGDLRRLLAQKPNLDGVKMHSVMGTQPLIIGPSQLATEALALMEGRRVNQILVVNEVNQKKHLLGALHIHDLTQAKII